MAWYKKAECIASRTGLLPLKEKEILDTPNDQDLGILVRLKYYEIKSIKTQSSLESKTSAD